MGKSSGWGRWQMPFMDFFSDHPKKLALRVRLLLALDCIIFALVVTSLTGPWYRQEWQVANGEILEWTLSLGRANFKVDCSSDSPEFLQLCKLLYGRLGGDLRGVSRSLCYAAERIQDTDLQVLLQETCTDLQLIEKLSISTGAGGGFCLCLMAFSIVAFLLHVGSGFRNRKAWRAGFWCRVMAWMALTTSCVLYALAAVKVEDLFHFRPPVTVAFDPAQAEPLSHELLYGFIVAISTSAILALSIPFWWKAAPFDPDPYFLEPRDIRQRFLV